MAEAKQELSRVVRAAATEPQWIQNRDVVVALVVGAKDAEAFLEWKKRSEAQTLAAALADVGALASSEDYALELPARADRDNDLAPNPSGRAERRRKPRAR
jgi:hypothetical protein